jgi:hypothetical protein
VQFYAYYTLLVSVGLLAVAWLWLIGIAFFVRRTWGFGLLLFPPSALVFVPAQWKRAAPPVALALVALLPLTWSISTLHYIPLGPHSEIVDGELHLTLTGWDRGADDYPLMLSRKNVVVLQMANPDVTDATLSHLEGMNELRELDLDHTQVSDEGLAVLARLPKLRDLRLSGTAISDAGFAKHLADKESLSRIVVTGTKISTKTLRKWKADNKDPARERRYLK